MANPTVRTRPQAAIRPTIGAAVPETAMVLAAGKGSRMGPLTEKRPKPMVPLKGRPLIDHIVARLKAAGIRRLVVNLHHRAGMLREHLPTVAGPDMDVLFSEEETLMDTGGGLCQARALLGEKPFFVVNGDLYWRDGVADTFSRLAQHWDATAMDALLLMVPTVSAIGYEGLGDFEMSPSGRLRRRREGFVSPFLYGGIQLVHPRFLNDSPEGAFSVNVLWDRAIEAGRLAGLRHEGEWMHVGTPAALAAAEELLTE